MPSRHRRHRARLVPPVPQCAFPFDQETWRILVTKLQLPPQQAKATELVLWDKGNQEIAEAMGISEPTVRSHLRRAFDRLGVETRMSFTLRVTALVHERWHLS